MLRKLTKKQIIAQEKSLEWYQKTHKIINGELYKICSLCNDWHLCNEEYFYKIKTGDGLYPYCKTCHKQKSAKYIEENKEWYKEYQRKYYKNDPDIKKNNYKRWRSNNEDHVKEYQSDYRKSEHGKEYYKNHRIKRNENKRHRITLKEWDACRLYFDYRCAYCGMTYEEHYEKEGQDLHKEHVIEGGKNDLRNCIPSCKSCNSTKHIYSLNTWYNKDNPRYSRERYLKIYYWLRYEHKKYLEKKKPKRKYKVRKKQ